MLLALKKSGKDKKDIDLVLSGDLLNQIMSSSFMARDLHLPFLGLYGACSTMTESLLLGSMLTDGGFAHNIIVGASSHFCTAERQFRMPVEHGNQRPPSAQWTATAAGSMIVSEQMVDLSKIGSVDDKQKIVNPRKIQVDCGTFGNVIDEASVFSGNIVSRMRKGELNRVLLISTGAMLSTISPFQGESIPGIAHGVVLETC